jgi:hypothetical protein
LLIGFGTGLNSRKSEEKTCGSPMLLNLEWVLSLQVGRLGSKWQVWVGVGGSFYHHRIIRLFLKKIFVVFEILCSFHSNFFFFFAL